MRNRKTTYLELNFNVLITVYAHHNNACPCRKSNPNLDHEVRVVYHSTNEAVIIIVAHISMELNRLKNGDTTIFIFYACL